MPTSAASCHVVPRGIGSDNWYPTPPPHSGQGIHFSTAPSGKSQGGGEPVYRPPPFPADATAPHMKTRTEDDLFTCFLHFLGSQPSSGETRAEEDLFTGLLQLGIAAEPQRKPGQRTCLQASSVSYEYVRAPAKTRAEDLFTGLLRFL